MVRPFSREGYGRLQAGPFSWVKVKKSLSRLSIRTCSMTWGRSMQCAFLTTRDATPHQPPACEKSRDLLAFCDLPIRVATHRAANAEPWCEKIPVAHRCDFLSGRKAPHSCLQCPSAEQTLEWRVRTLGTESGHAHMEEQDLLAHTLAIIRTFLERESGRCRAVAHAPSQQTFRTSLSTELTTDQSDE
jgi:hypothetical protein